MHYGLVLKMLLVLDNTALVQRRIRPVTGSSRGNIGFYHLPCCGRASANNACITRIRWNNIYRNCSTVEAERNEKIPHFQPKSSAQTGNPTLQGPSTAPPEPILLEFWLKTRKSTVNKVRKVQISTTNRLKAGIKKPPGGSVLSKEMGLIP